MLTGTGGLHGKFRGCEFNIAIVRFICVGPKSEEIDAIPEKFTLISQPRCQAFGEFNCVSFWCDHFTDVDSLRF